MSEDYEVLEDELDSLKLIAERRGIKHHPAIGLATLKAKIAEADEKEAATEEEVAPVVAAGEETKAQLISRLKKEANRLIRARITCMNPNKSEWEGELFSFGNNAVGTVKKFVPYNVEYHIPQCILNMIKARNCQVFYTVTDPATRQKNRKGKSIKEFGIEILEPLTQKQLNELAQRQAMANGTSDSNQ